jgi:hypothetical protein
MGAGRWRRAAEPPANGEWRFARQRVRTGWRGASLDPSRVISRRCTVATTRASDRWISRRLGVHAQPGYDGDDGDDVARRVRRRAGSALWRPTGSE